jgi:hypothetical protein
VRTCDVNSTGDICLALPLSKRGGYNLGSIQNNKRQLDKKTDYLPVLRTSTNTKKTRSINCGFPHCLATLGMAELVINRATNKVNLHITGNSCFTSHTT